MGWDSKPTIPPTYFTIRADTTSKGKKGGVIEDPLALDLAYRKQARFIINKEGKFWSYEEFVVNADEMWGGGEIMPLRGQG